MKLKFYWGVLDTKKGFIFDPEFLFKMMTEKGSPPENTCRITRELFIKDYNNYLLNK
mgnify:CR=1 FL=1